MWVNDATRSHATIIRKQTKPSSCQGKYHSLFYFFPLPSSSFLLNFPPFTTFNLAFIHTDIYCQYLFRNVFFECVDIFSSYSHSAKKWHEEIILEEKWNDFPFSIFNVFFFYIYLVFYIFIAYNTHTVEIQAHVVIKIFCIHTFTQRQQ